MGVWGLQGVIFTPKPQTQNPARCLIRGSFQDQIPETPRRLLMRKTDINEYFTAWIRLPGG